MDSLPLGGLVEMRTAENVYEGGNFIVVLKKDGEKIGHINIEGKSRYYVEDVIKNWEIGILKEDNEHIIKENV